MKNHFFQMIVFCLILHVACSIASVESGKPRIELSKKSEANLLNYALKKSLRDNYWPVSAVVTLEFFCCANQVDNENGVELEYEARFCGRFPEMREGCVFFMCRKRSALISATTLRNNGVIVPEQK